MNIYDACIGHIVSQLSFKYLPCPAVLEPSSSDSLRGISQSFWQSYLQENALNSNKAWANSLQKYLNGSIDVILGELRLIEDMFATGVQYLSICDPIYPYLLKQLKDPPWGIFYRGNIEQLLKPAIAIVGSRKASFRACEESKILASLLSQEGALIVSGGALGCDAAAHEGACDSFGREANTAVVLAGFVDHLYPRRNLQLFEKILTNGGMILSERLPGSIARPMDFPIRNRIIAGLSNRTIIMQAAKRSGAMATANLALNQGRDVMVLRAEENDVRYEGNQILMAQGALSFSRAEDYFHLNWQ